MTLTYFCDINITHICRNILKRQYLGYGSREPPLFSSIYRPQYNLPGQVMRSIKKVEYSGGSRLPYSETINSYGDVIVHTAQSYTARNGLGGR